MFSWQADQQEISQGLFGIKYCLIRGASYFTRFTLNVGKVQFYLMTLTHTAKSEKDFLNVLFLLQPSVCTLDMKAGTQAGC